MFAEDLETFLEIPAHGDLEVQVAERAVLVIDGDEPAIGPEAFEHPGTHRRDRPPEESRRIDQMAAVGQEEVASPIRLGIPFGPSAFPLVTGIGWRLSVIVYR